MRRHLAAGLAGLLAAGAFLSGCGGSAEPQSLPRPTASTSPSASPTPPVMPEAAKKKTKAGAEATVRYFLAALEYAGDTGDTKLFDSTYASTCTRCASIAEGIRQTYADGGSIRGGGWRPTRLRFHAIEGGIAYIDAVVDYESQVWVKSADGDRATSPAQSNVLKAFQLVWRQKVWKVGALDPQE